MIGAPVHVNPELDCSQMYYTETAFRITPYTFPELQLLETSENWQEGLVYVPSTRCIILGRGSDPDVSLHKSAILKDGIPVMRRPSGGETVIVSPETLVIGVVRTSVKLQPFRRFFHEFNQKIIQALESVGVRGLSHRGISDICIGNMKILGSSIYWNRNRLLYHAVLNVAEPIDNLEKYLKHPPREPDYRGKRTHQEFVTSLKESGCAIPVTQIQQVLENHLQITASITTS